MREGRNLGRTTQEPGMQEHSEALEHAMGDRDHGGASGDGIHDRTMRRPLGNGTASGGRGGDTAAHNKIRRNLDPHALLRGTSDDSPNKDHVRSPEPGGKEDGGRKRFSLGADWIQSALQTSGEEEHWTTQEAERIDAILRKGETEAGNGLKSRMSGESNNFSPNGAHLSVG